MIHSEIIVHMKGRTAGGCAACVYAMIFGIDEMLARKACKTTAKGTHMYNMYDAIKATGLKAHHVYLNKDFYELKDFIAALSYHFPIAANCQYRSKRLGAKGGRDSLSQHAILFCDGKIFDSTQSGPVDIDCYENVFDKKLTINDIILIEEERPNYGKKNFLNIY